MTQPRHFTAAEAQYDAARLRLIQQPIDETDHDAYRAKWTAVNDLTRLIAAERAPFLDAPRRRRK